jgi:glycosyltransferase involved in cell wall biosynthesis
VALLPFALNEATRFISPTKTPEYLAAGLPVVSTPVRDVDQIYGKSGLVFIGRDKEQFARGIEQQLCQGRSPVWQAEVKAFLSSLSWDKTWASMQRLMAHELSHKKRLQEKRSAAGKTILSPQVSVARV